MTNVRRFTTALALICVMNLTLIAGEIHIPGPPPPPLDPSAATSNTQMAEVGSGSALSSSVTDAALNLLQELLLVF
jgi:hypothetical protein